MNIAEYIRSINPFDLVIVDPPAMTTQAAQVPSVLAAYQKLYRAAARQVRPGGALVAACCTSRIVLLTARPGS